MIAPLLLALLLGFSLAEAADPEPEGVCAYAAGRFGVAAFTLDQSNRDLRRRGVEPSPVATYLLGRAFRELGIRGLALRHLADGESRGGPELRLLARRELARIHFDAADPAAVLEVWARTAGNADAETSYLAGLAAAQRRDWLRAVAILSEIASTDDLHPYARYARAQSAAAGGDLAAALADLEEVIRRPPPRREPRPPLELAARDLLEPLGGESGLLQVVFHSTERSVSLDDRAQLLRGKILYLEGRTAEARAAFAAVTGDGRTGLDALGGLVVAGGGREIANQRPAPRSRPLESAALLAAKAAAAEAREDFRTAWQLRSELGELAAARLAALDHLASDASSREELAADLGEFWLRLRRSRSQERWHEEAGLVATSCSFGPPASPLDVSFRPHDEIFYSLWDRSRSHASLRHLAALMAQSQELSVDLDSPPEHRRFWELWRVPVDERLRAALFVLRLANLRLRMADHLHRSSALPGQPSRELERGAIDDAEGDLRALYGNDGGSEAFEDAVELTESTTDAAIVRLWRYVDRSPPLPSAAGPGAGRRISQVIDRLRAANRRLASDLAARIAETIDDVRREQTAWFERIEADNNRSLSRVYARLGASSGAVSTGPIR